MITQNLKNKIHSVIEEYEKESRLGVADDFQALEMSIIEEIGNTLGGCRWYIWSNEHLGWWLPAYHGYTQLKSEAGLYGYEEALGIIERANAFIKNDGVPHEAMILCTK